MFSVVLIYFNRTIKLSNFQLQSFLWYSVLLYICIHNAFKMRVSGIHATCLPSCSFAWHIQSQGYATILLLRLFDLHMCIHKQFATGAGPEADRRQDEQDCKFPLSVAVVNVVWLVNPHRNRDTHVCMRTPGLGQFH